MTNYVITSMKSAIVLNHFYHSVLSLNSKSTGYPRSLEVSNFIAIVKFELNRMRL